jgi:uncharacterized protein
MTILDCIAIGVLIFSILGVAANYLLGPSAVRCPYFQKAFGWSVPIGGLAGLVGLGGGEFRLPVLMYVVGYPARTAVPLNLAVSLITLTFALVVRSKAVSVAALVPYLNEVAGLAVGGVASAFYGARSETC